MAPGVRAPVPRTVPRDWPLKGEFRVGSAENSLSFSFIQPGDFKFTMSNSQSTDALDDVHDTVSTVYHDLNNPLSIISGNAQFLLEISREEDLDEQFVSSAQDIKEAAQRMADSLHKLTRLKEKLENER